MMNRKIVLTGEAKQEQDKKKTLYGINLTNKCLYAFEYNIRLINQEVQHSLYLIILKQYMNPKIVEPNSLGCH